MIKKIVTTDEDYLNSLNAEQRAAATALEGPVLVLAGPGTGKTHLLSLRSAHIIRTRSAAPENILILSFTNSAAKAMKERLVKILGSDGYNIETATFHSFANAILLESEEAANHIQEKIQITDIEKVQVLEYILDRTEDIDAIRPFRARYFYLREIERRLGDLKKEGITPAKLAEYLASLAPADTTLTEKQQERLKALAKVYTLYEECKSGIHADIFDKRGRYDFDDMIMVARDVLRCERGLRASLRQRYSHIMVDEYQDTNGAQMDLLFELIDETCPNICCVGDDDQSIYRFQGASINNFSIFKKRFPAATVITLKDNYRSTEDIIRLSGRIIGQIPSAERVAAKTLNAKKEFSQRSILFHEFTTDSEELLYLTQKIEELKTQIASTAELSDAERAAPYNNIAVLVRKRRDISRLIDAFLRAGIPYSTDGKEDISAQVRVRQMIDALRLAHLKDPTDAADRDAILYRILTSDYTQVRFTDLLRLIGLVKTRKREARERGASGEITLVSTFLGEFPAAGDKEVPEPDETARLAIMAQVAFEDPGALHRAAWAIERLLGDAQDRPVHDILLRYIDDAGIFRYILKKYADDRLLKIRDLRALSSLVNAVKEADLAEPAIDLADFLEELSIKKEHGVPLAGELVTMSQEGVRLLTAHGSKGLEFHTVFIPFCLEDKNWPIRAKADLIPLPGELIKSQAPVNDKIRLTSLALHDETRLFYVASSRARSNLIYTASPNEHAVTSSYLSGIGLPATRPAFDSTEERVIKSFLTPSTAQDPFIGTDAVLKDIIANLTMNPTSLNNYLTCKRKFLYDNVIMLPSEKRLGLVFGNCVHKALEDTYLSFMQKSVFPDFNFFKSAFIRELDYQGAGKSLAPGCLRHLETLRGWFSREARSPIRPLGLEKKLAIMLSDDLLFTGKYDKTELADPDRGLVRVVDYKTGKPDEHLKKLATGTHDLASDQCDGYLRQLVAYKLLFDRDKHRDPATAVGEGVLVFVEPVRATVAKYGLREGEFVSRKIEITDEMVRELESVILSAWRDIHRLSFERLPQRDESKCGFCDFDHICWQA